MSTTLLQIHHGRMIKLVMASCGCSRLWTRSLTLSCGSWAALSMNS